MNNLDASSIQQRSVYSQNRCTCGKWGTDTNKTYGTSEFCTCDDGKDVCTCYRRNTNKTFNKTMSSNDQNIFIQEGNSSDYCNCECGERGERQIFSNAGSDYNMNVKNILTDEEMNRCTCGQKTTIQSTDNNEYNKDRRKGSSTSNVITRIKKTERREYNNQNNMNGGMQYSNIVTTSYNEIPMQTTIQTTDYEDKELNEINKKVIVNKEINIIREYSSLTSSQAELVLINYNWNIEILMNDWFDKMQKIKESSGSYLQLALFTFNKFLYLRLPALLHQFRASCQSIIFHVGQLYFQLV